MRRARTEKSVFLAVIPAMGIAVENESFGAPSWWCAGRRYDYGFARRRRGKGQTSRADAPELVQGRSKSAAILTMRHAVPFEFGVRQVCGGKAARPGPLWTVVAIQLADSQTL